MASQQSKKKVSGARNGDRKNGKAWKKNPAKPKKKTEARQLRDFEILQQREARYALNLARREAEKKAAAEKAHAEAVAKAIEQDKIYVPERIKAMAAA